jgi:VCBS repeat-containing protein
MKAKELKEAAEMKRWGVDKGKYLFTADELKAFCEQLCREQKAIDKITIDSYSGYDGSEVNLKVAFEAIDNAPMPEL